MTIFGRAGFNSTNISLIMNSILAFILLIHTGCGKEFLPLATDDPTTVVMGTNTGILKELLWDPSDSAIHIDPGYSADSVRDGSVLHPFRSFSEVKWIAGKVYALKRGSTIHAPTIMLAADHVTLASYGEGERPVIISSSDAHAVSTDWNGGIGITIRDIEVYAPNAQSCVIFRDNSKNVKLLNARLHGAVWGLRALNHVDGIYVYNTEIFDTKDDGMFIKNSVNIDIHRCYIHHVNQNWQPPDTPETKAAGDGIQFSGCNHWRVRQNKIDRSDTGNKFCFISNNPGQDDGIFEYNELTGPMVNGFSIYIGDGKNIIIRYNDLTGSNSPIYSHATGLKIYYNIFREMNGPLFVSGSAEVYNNLFYHCRMGVEGGTIVAKNNIFDLGSVERTVFKVKQLSESNNLFVVGKATKNSITGDPKYLDAAEGDFRIGSDSDCVDNGVKLGFLIDLEGKSVPMGSAPDIGPFEYSPGL